MVYFTTIVCVNVITQTTDETSLRDVQS